MATKYARQSELILGNPYWNSKMARNIFSP